MTKHPRLVLLLLVLALVVGLALLLASLPAHGGQVDWWAYTLAGG